MISRGTQWDEAPLVKITVHIGGLSPLKLLGFSKFIDFTSKVFCFARINYALLHVY